MFGKNFKKQINIKGFTLVELMVAIAVFSTVMVVATGALLNVIDADQKAQTLKTAVNNVSFALESMSRDMRMGKNYQCYDSNFSVKTCDYSVGDVFIGYSNSQQAFLNPDGSHKNAYYKYDSNSIKACIEKLVGDTCTNSTFYPITSSEVNITSLKFYVINTGQPRIVITLSGKAGTKDKTSTTFDLQTSVSQRSRLVQ